jgi:ABC-2 type transport system permease protein
MMFMTLVKPEWTVLLRRTSTRLSLGLFLALMALAGWNGGQRVEQQQATVVQAMGDEQKARETLATQAAAFAAQQDAAALAPAEAAPAQTRRPPPAAVDPGAVGLRALSPVAYLNPRPLAAFSVGQSDIEPNYYRLSIRAPYTFLGTYELENPVNLMAGSFDIAFVIVFLLPVLLLALSYNMIASDRESGVLSLVLSQPVSGRRYAFSKFVARALLSAAVLIVGGLVAATAAGISLTEWTSWEALGVWFALSFAYALFWIAVALALNVSRASSAATCVRMAAVWLVFVVIIPTTSNVIAQTLAPSPSRLLLAAQVREASAEADREAAKTLEAFYFDHPEAVEEGGPQGAEGGGGFFVRILASDTAVEKAIQPTLQAFAESASRREAWIGRLQFLSPAMMTQLALNRLSGTDDARYRNFLERVDEFHASWSGFFIPRILSAKSLAPSDYREMPRFEAASQTADTSGGFAAGLTFLISVLGILLILAVSRAKRLQAFA